MPRRHKYNVSPAEQRTYKGRVYDSKAEMQYAERLDLDPDVMWWLRQPGFDLGEDTRYRADFLVSEFDGNIHAIDVKGMETPAFRKIKKLWRKYGIMELRVVKKGVTVEVITKT